MVVDVPVDLLPGVVIEIGKIALWLQALGIVIVLWLVFQTIALIVNRKRRKALYRMHDDIIRIEKKINKIERILTKKKI